MSMSDRRDGYSARVLVDIDQIDRPLRPASLMRVEIKDETVAEYAENFDDLPEILLTAEAGVSTHWLDDGRQRIEAARRLKRKQVWAMVRSGTYEDSYRAASRANDHGDRVTNADKRRRVEEALRAFPGESQNKIADICGVSSHLVRNLDNRQPTEPGAQLKTIGKDGKARRKPARKPKPKDDPPPEPEPAPDLPAEPPEPVAMPDAPEVEPGPEPDPAPPLKPPEPDPTTAIVPNPSLAPDPAPDATPDPADESISRSRESANGEEDMAPPRRTVSPQPRPAATTPHADREWLESLHARPVVPVLRRQFDLDALWVRRVRAESADSLARFQASLPACGLSVTPAEKFMGQVYRQHFMLANTPPPETWLLCPSCEGRKPEGCAYCYGRGYFVRCPSSRGGGLRGKRKKAQRSK